MNTRTAHKLYGLMAEFDDPTHAVKAARSAYEEGYRGHGRLQPVSG